MGAGSVSDILLRNAVILTMDDDFTRIDRGAVGTDGRIAWLAPDGAAGRRASPASTWTAAAAWSCRALSTRIPTWR